MRSYQGRPEDVPAASSNASSRACVSGSTVLRSAPSAALDRSSSEAVFKTGLSRSSWSSMNDSTCMERCNVVNCAHIIYQTRKRAKEMVLHTYLYIKMNKCNFNLSEDRTSFLNILGNTLCLLESADYGLTCEKCIWFASVNTVSPQYDNTIHQEVLKWQQPRNDPAMTSGYKVQSYPHWHKAIVSSNETN